MPQNLANAAIPSKSVYQSKKRNSGSVPGDGIIGQLDKLAMIELEA